MKFSISFKYSNVTFKNKETKETISFETKSQDGNSFTFDNVDEDVVIGIVKGIKNRKASEVFQYDDLRTNFINTMAKNKCKELYDKIDKGEWNIDDIAISNITIKDLEFTKPTMNARETITMESRKTNENFMDTIHKDTQEDLSELIEVVSKACEEIDIIHNIIDNSHDVSDKTLNRLLNVRTMLLNALPSTKTSKKMGWSESSKKSVKWRRLNPRG